MESKKYNKLLKKKKQTHRYREQTSGYQLGEGRVEGQDRGRELRGTNYYVQKKLQGCIVQNREYSQYFAVTINGI